MAAAIEEARGVLAATPTADLLTKAYAFTHQIDRLERLDRSDRTVDPDDVRAMRDLITAEVIRRTGGH